MKTLILSILVVGNLTNAQQLSQATVAPQTHTMIDSISMTTLNQKLCDLVVALSLDKKEVRVIRLDPPKGKYNMTYFVDHPELVSRYGVSYRTSEVGNTHGQSIKKVRASFDISKEKNDLLLFVTLDDDSVLERKVSVTADFFKDHAKQCIK